MKETKLYAKLKQHLGECDRVENSAMSGMADVFYNIDGKTGWIETKVAKGDLVYFEKFQPHWLRKHWKLGARIFVAVMDKHDQIHMFPAGVILDAPRTPVGKWATVNMLDLPIDYAVYSWESMRKQLTS